MTTEETAALLTIASGGVGTLVLSALRLAFPARKFRQRTIQPIALAVSSACVVGYTAAQPGPMDWKLVALQVGGAWLLANSRLGPRPKPKT